MTKKAVFAGSFDPFTNGHLDVVKKASVLFDTVYILIGINVKKQRAYPPETMKQVIETVLARNSILNVSVVIFEGLLVDFAKENDVKYIVRGLRNSADYTYEEEMAIINTMLNSQLEYVYLRADRSHISSSIVKELHSFGKDVSDYVPEEVLSLILS